MIELIVLLIGLALIYAEFYLPGGVVGGIGAVMIIAAIVLFSLSSTLIPSLLFIGLSIVLLAGTIRLALWTIPRSDPERGGVYSSGDQEGYSASHYEKEAIGKQGTVYSDLKPGGHILVDGKRHLAISKSGYIPKGESVVVIGGEGESLIVKYLNHVEEKEK